MLDGEIDVVGLARLALALGSGLAHVLGDQLANAFQGLGRSGRGFGFQSAQGGAERLHQPAAEVMAP